MVHASRGRLAPASAAAAQRGRDRHRARRAALFGDDARLGRDGRATTRSIREHIAHVVAGLRRTSTRGSPAGRLHAAARPPRDSLTFATATGKARFTVNPVTRGRGAARAPAAADGALARPVQHHGVRARRPLPRHQGGRRVVFVNRRRPGRARPRATATWSTWSASGPTASAARRPSGVVEYPTPRGCAAAYFPEANVLVPLDSTADDQQHPDVEVGDHPPGAARPSPPRAKHVSDTARYGLSLTLGILGATLRYSERRRTRTRRHFCLPLVEGNSRGFRGGSMISNRFIRLARSAWLAPLLAVGALVAQAGVASAGAQWFSGKTLLRRTTGNPNNNGKSCRSAGFSTIQSAINTAPDGATVSRMRRDLHEQVVISKPLSLVGQQATIDESGVTPTFTITLPGLGSRPSSPPWSS